MEGVELSRGPMDLVEQRDDRELASLHFVISQTRELIGGVRDIREAVMLIRRASATEGVVIEALKSCHALEEQQFALRQEAAETHLRTQRKAGELLSRVLKHKGGRPSACGPTGVVPPGAHVKLRDLGIKPQESHRWQRLASIPAGQFDEFIAEANAGGRELTTTLMLRHAHRLLNAGGSRVDSRPSSRSALLAEYEREQTHLANIIWLDPGRLAEAMTPDRGAKALGQLRRLRVWIDELEAALSGGGR